MFCKQRDDTLERLAQVGTMFFVCSLRTVSEDEQHEEIRVGDVVLLVGECMVVAAHNAADASIPCIMMDWLEIQEAFGSEKGRRDRK